MIGWIIVLVVWLGGVVISGIHLLQDHVRRWMFPLGLSTNEQIALYLAGTIIWPVFWLGYAVTVLGQDLLDWLDGRSAQWYAIVPMALAVLGLVVMLISFIVLTFGALQ